jgi:hypothetical protein
MSTLKLDKITGLTGNAGDSAPITLSGDTATLETGVTIGSGVTIPAAGITGTIGSGVTIPAAGITGVLPVGVTGGSGLDALSAGKVLQVVQGISTELDATDSGTFQDSGLSASLIPASEDNKVLIMAMTSHLVTASDDYAGITIYRGTEATWNATDLGTGGNGYGFANMLVVGATALITNVTINYLDSPSTDVSVKYTMAHRGWSGGCSTVQHNSVEATIILMEIQGP